MKIGLLGKKVGMTRVFRDNGKAEAVTVLEVTPSVVTAVKSVERDGYAALQLGYGTRKEKHVNKCEKGFFDKIGTELKKVLYEVRTDVELKDVAVGTVIGIENFEAGDYVDVAGTSIGKGFQGVMKRHNFHGGRGSHGDKTGRRTGSIGQSAYPSRVFKGMRGPGRMGGKNVTTQNIEVVDVDLENNLLILKGAVPGAKNSVVKISISLKKGNDKDLVVVKNDSQDVSGSAEETVVAQDVNIDAQEKSEEINENTKSE